MIYRKLDYFRGVLAYAMFSVTFGFAAEGLDWQQWRGPDRDGSSAGERWPQSLDTSNLVRIWRVDLGPSYSGPIVKNGVVFTTESVNDEREAVRAFNLGTGKQKWLTDWEGMMRVPFFAKKNGSWIRSTPATDGKRIFVAGMRDVLVCLDAETGKKIWSVDFPKNLGTELPSFGFVCSPLLTEDSVIVQAGASVVKLRKSDGEIVWRSMEDGGGMNGSAFSSPILAKLGGVEQLIVQGRKELCGLDLSSGKELWKQEVPAFRGMNILTPVVYNDSLFTSTYGGKSFSYSVRNKSGKWSPSVNWELKQQGYMSTPVVIEGHAYLHLRNKKFACVDLKSGSEAWVSDKRFGEYWSMIARGSQILALDQTGVLRLIQASPEKLNIISERKVSDQDSWAHLAISGHYVIVRELKALSVFKWKNP